jgi:TusA-related sulfurtransferase
MKVQSSEGSMKSITDLFIDITDQVCPLTFVKTKLALESMKKGQILEVRLKGAEPLENVPRSVEQHGHIILSLKPEVTNGNINSVHRMILKKI